PSTLFPYTTLFRSGSKLPNVSEEPLDLLALPNAKHRHVYWEEAEISATFCSKSADFREISQKPRTKAPQSAPIVVVFPKGARRTPGLRQPTVQEDIWL